MPNPAPFTNQVESAFGTGVTSLQVNLPTTVAFDASRYVWVVFVQYFSDAAVSLSTPADWQHLRTDDNPSFFFDHVYQSIYWRVYASGVSTVSFSFGVSVTCGAEVLLVQDASPASPNPITVQNANLLDLQTVHDTPSLTGGYVDSLAIAHWYTDRFTQFEALTALDILFEHSSSTPIILMGATNRTQVSSFQASAFHTTATLIGPIDSIATLLYINPAQGPSTPLIQQPIPTAQITVGSTFIIQWTAADSPIVAQSSLVYEIDRSSDNGVSWTNITTTSAGATTYSWNTTGLSVGSQYLIRIRAKDTTNTLNGLWVKMSGTFSLVAEVAPPAPTNLSPSSGARDKSSNVTLSWLHGGGAGNPQTKFTLQWSRDAFASHTTTIGPTTTSTQSTTVDFSGEAIGATITWKVKTTGVTLDSAYANPVAFQVAVAPATPNITAPTAGSPPTTPLPTITFTEADSFSHRRVRFLTDGNQVFDSGFVASTALSFQSPYSLTNGIEYVLKLSTQNQYGLVSAEDTETFTPSFSGPDEPTVQATANDTGGYIQLAITNLDSPTYNELWRFRVGETQDDAIRIARNIAPNASFQDNNVISGVRYHYFARAYNDTGLFTDSVVI